MKIDLHAHTNHSDGTCPPGALVEEASRREVGVLAVTDHDTVGGVEAALETGERLGVRVLWGVELSSRDGTEDVHVLGYFRSRPPAPFLGLLERQRGSRRERAEAMMKLLAGMGKFLTWEDLRAAGASDDSVGRPHVARALVTKGFCGTFPEAFRRWLGPGRSAYVAHRVPRPEEAVRAVREAGGVPVVAHPGRIQDPGILERMIAAGLMGLEVHHPDHEPDQVAKLTFQAQKKGLIRTGGSDFHGLPGERFAKLGDYPTLKTEFARLEAAWS